LVRELLDADLEDLLVAGPVRVVDAGEVDCSNLAARAVAADSFWIL
jgi:hypothetical protein